MCTRIGSVRYCGGRKHSLNPGFKSNTSPIVTAKNSVALNRKRSILPLFLFRLRFTLSLPKGLDAAVV